LLGAALGSVAGIPFQENETIGELLRYALVRRSCQYKALSIHRLFQTVIKDAMDEPTYQQWVEHTIQAIERVFPDAIDPAHWSTCKRLLPHTQACAVLIENHDLCSQEAATLLYRMAIYLSEYAWYSEAEPLYQRALRI
jgi:hypothetical protein